MQETFLIMDDDDMEGGLGAGSEKINSARSQPAGGEKRCEVGGGESARSEKGGVESEKNDGVRLEQQSGAEPANGGVESEKKDGVDGGAGLDEEFRGSEADLIAHKSIGQLQRIPQSNPM